MIINATTGQGFTGVLSYVEKEHEKGLTQEQRPEVLQEVNCFGSAKEKAQQMRFVAQENSKASRPVLHLSVSFQENEKLTPQQRDKVLNDVAKEFGATPENNQYVIVKHNDAKHEHYHIVINKVGFDKSNISTQYVQNKCQVVADKLEQKHELQRVQGRKVVYDPSQEKGYRFTTKQERDLAGMQKRSQAITPKKEYVKEHVTKAMAESRSLTEFKDRLAEKGIRAELTTNVRGLSGTKYIYNGASIKGTDIKVKAKEVEKNIEANRAKPQQEQAIDSRKIEKLEINHEIKIFNEVKGVHRQIEKLDQENRNNAQHGFKMSYQSLDKDFEVKEEKGRLMLYDNKNYSTTDITELKQMHASESKRHQEFKQYLDNKAKYDELMQTEPKKVPLFFGKEEKAYNERLAKAKYEATEPKRPKDEAYPMTKVQQELKNEERDQYKIVINMKNELKAKIAQAKKNEQGHKKEATQENSTAKKLTNQMEANRAKNLEKNKDKKRGLGR